jgi:KipI family sensor histidine kinase inhibitor
MSDSWIRTIRAEGDRCLIIELGDAIDERIGLRSRQLAREIERANWLGVVDVIATFAAVAVYFVPPVDSLKTKIHNLAQTLTDDAISDVRRVTIPICYDAQFGLDLEHVAAHAGLSVPDLIQAHQRTVCRVFMLGFSPGLPYLGLFDERFNLPRLKSPRTRVAGGTIGVANRQAVIYPSTLPGGWNLVGATPLPLFDPYAPEPSLLMPGDEVRFEAITLEAYNDYRASSGKA